LFNVAMARKDVPLMIEEAERHDVALATMPSVAALWPPHVVSIGTLYTGEREVHQREAAAKVILSRSAGRR
jgi:hypothetical protein